MKLRYIIIQTLLMLANTALVYLAAWALGFDIFASIGGRRYYLYLAIALVLLLLENFIWDKLHGKI